MIQKNIFIENLRTGEKKEKVRLIADEGKFLTDETHEASSIDIDEIDVNKWAEQDIPPAPEPEPEPEEDTVEETENTEETTDEEIDYKEAYLKLCEEVKANAAE